MRLRTYSGFLILILFLASCADYEPSVNTTGLDIKRYNKDLKYCRKEGDKADIFCANGPGIFGLYTLTCVTYSFFSNLGQNYVDSREGKIDQCMVGKGYRLE